MLESIQKGFSSLFARWSGQQLWSSEQLLARLNEIRATLIEADVALPVADRLVQRWAAEWKQPPLTKRGTTAEQWFMHSVHRALTELMGGAEKLSAPFTGQRRPAIGMVVGLQGSGKTTTTVKLARYWQRQGQKVLVTSLDPYRPGAGLQLKQLAEKSGVAVHLGFSGDSSEGRPNTAQVLELAEAAVQTAEEQGFDLVLMDTAGRLHINEGLMAELRYLVERWKPEALWMVVDALWGQSAAETLEAFQSQLPLRSTFLTKWDADVKGGVALSVAGLIRAPLEFVGTGEHGEDLETFDAAGMAQRLMGLGDFSGLIEQMEQRLDQEAIADRWHKGGNFDLDDFALTLKQIEQMGGVKPLLERLPLGLKEAANASGLSHLEIYKLQAMLRSMTPQERRRPWILNASRKRRITLGSGTQPRDLQQLLKQYEMQRTMMQQLQQMGPMGLLQRAQSMWRGGS